MLEYKNKGYEDLAETKDWNQKYSGPRLFQTRCVQHVPDLFLIITGILWELYLIIDTYYI